MRYAPELKYFQDVKHATADALSRAPACSPTREAETFVEEVEELKDMVMRNLPATDARIEEIKEAQVEDSSEKLCRV